MRALDNMTPQELDTLALKGMTAPHKALRHHVTGAIERGEAEPIIEQRAPNKAQHSPKLPSAMLESVGYHKGYKAAKAHADKLAEACNKVVMNNHGVGNDGTVRISIEAFNACVYATANYEAAQ